MRTAMRTGVVMCGAGCFCSRKKCLQLRVQAKRRGLVQICKKLCAPAFEFPACSSVGGAGARVTVFTLKTLFSISAFSLILFTHVYVS